MKATRWRRFRVVLAATLPLAAITVGVDAGFADGFAYVTIRVIPRQNIYIFARGCVNHQGREFFDAPGLY
jgi:hypothetical protein